MMGSGFDFNLLICWAAVALFNSGLSMLTANKIEFKPKNDHFQIFTNPKYIDLPAAMFGNKLFFSSSRSSAQSS